MADPNTTPDIIVERYTAAMRSGLEFAARRAEALQDYWTAVPRVRGPADVLALQSEFWRRAIDDYGAVLTTAIRPAEAAAPATAPRKIARAA